MPDPKISSKPPGTGENGQPNPGSPPGGHQSGPTPAITRAEAISSVKTMVLMHSSMITADEVAEAIVNYFAENWPTSAIQP